ncbi:MAG: helix-turn-helix domain-containing protein [Burkholderiales bacterium]
MSLSINGELLKAARLRRGLSIATWARELMVSETQLRSLEEGEDRGFYNDTHRRQIAQKYAAVLGVDAAGLFAHVPKRSDPRRSAGESASGLDLTMSQASVLRQHDVSLALAKAHEGTGDLRRWQGKRKSRQARTEYMLAGGVLAALAMWFSVDAWKHQRAGQTSNPLSVVEQRFDDPPSALNARPVELAKGGRVDLALAKPSELDYPQPFVSKPTESQSAGATSRGRETVNRRDEATSKLHRKDEASNKRASDKPGLEERSRSSAKELRYPDRKALADASNYQGLAGNSQGAAASGQGQVGSNQGSADNRQGAGNNGQGPDNRTGLVAVAPSSGPESRHVDLCEVSDRMASVVVPVSRLKNTPYVHVASGVSQKVCVRSADGRVERMSLSANEARSIFGKAPFTVVTEQPSSVEIFYLGARVRHNGESRVLKIVDPDPMS